MNRLFLLVAYIALFVFPIQTKGQQIRGVYLSSNDFQKNKTTFTKGKGIKCKAKLHDEPYKSYINIRYRDSSFVLVKDSIFGYKDIENTQHRFYNKLIYQILNPNEKILLYKIEKKTGSPKNQQIITSYFFSNGANTNILELTIPNLEKTFSDNELFQDYLEIHFKTDNDLIEFDKEHKVYKVNRLLELSTHKKN
jgi:hypothetical protein